VHRKAVDMTQRYIWSDIQVSGHMRWSFSLMISGLISTIGPYLLQYRMSMQFSQLCEGERPTSLATLQLALLYLLHLLHPCHYCCVVALT
jgi:hypothetical protein